MNHEITDRFLNELENGESAYITKVRGYGAFRKRITEMGFVSGTLVKSIKKAPFTRISSNHNFMSCEDVYL